LGNDKGTLEAKGIWGALSVWKDEHGQTWVYVRIWGPVSKGAPKFSITNGLNPDGCIMAFKISAGSSVAPPTLEASWISGDFDGPGPVVIANGVVFASSTGEKPHQTKSWADVIFAGQPPLTKR
jgi:hypothetical protein